MEVMGGTAARVRYSKLQEYHELKADHARTLLVVVRFVICQFRQLLPWRTA